MHCEHAGNDGYSTNAFKWILFDETEKKYSMDYSATRHLRGGGDSVDIKDKDVKVTFWMVYDIPIDAPKLYLKYDGNFKVVYNGNIVF